MDLFSNLATGCSVALTPAKLGFAQAVVPESAGDGGDAGIALNSVASLADLAADIAARGPNRGRAQRGAREG